MGSKIKIRKRRRRTMKGGSANDVKANALKANPLLPNDVKANPHLPNKANSLKADKVNALVPKSNPPVTTPEKADLVEKSKAVNDAEKKVEVLQTELTAKNADVAELKKKLEIAQTELKKKQTEFEEAKKKAGVSGSCSVM